MLSRKSTGLLGLEGFTESSRSQIRRKVKERTARARIPLPDGFTQDDAEAVAYTQVLYGLNAITDREKHIRDLITHYRLDEKRARFHVGAVLSPVYTDIGPEVGMCSLCGRRVYATPGAITVELVRRSEEDKITASARWCRNDRTIYCLGCIVADQKCKVCGGGTVDHDHLREAGLPGV